MKINIQRDLLLEKISLASRFTSSKLSSLTTLQGILIKGDENKIHLYSTDLTSWFHTIVNTQSNHSFQIITDPRKIVEFLQFLNPGKLDLEIREKQIILSQGKTKGSFPILASQEFPLPPEFKGKKQKLSAEFLKKNLPLLLFAASSDDTRPILTAVNFVASDEYLILVATDGFRLSLVKTKKEIDLPSMLIPGDFIGEVLRLVKDEKEVSFSYSLEEKTIYINIGENDLYSRMIEGEFPPYERVVPSEKKTTITLEREDLLRNIKLISVFARDFSNIIVCEFNKDGLRVRPKKDNNEENSAYQEVEIKGEEQKVAFNYKFILDLLNNLDSKNINIEMLRSDAPVVFKTDNNPEFLHIVMPVRIQE